MMGVPGVALYSYLSVGGRRAEDARRPEAVLGVWRPWLSAPRGVREARWLARCRQSIQDRMNSIDRLRALCVGSRRLAGPEQVPALKRRCRCRTTSWLVW